MAKNKEMARLFITLGVDEKTFRTQLKNIDRDTKAIAKGMVAGGTAVVASIGAMTYAWMNAGDQIDKMRQRTNWSAESLSELRHVADITGTELEGIEKATRKLSQSIVEGAQGMASYTRYFDALGLSAAELKELNPEEAFWKVAEAAANMGNEVEQTAIMTQLFGRSGTQLLPMLKEGKAGIDELRQEAHDLGLVFDEDAASAAANLQDNITRLKGAVTGLTYEVAEAAAPTFDAWAVSLTQTAKGIKEFANDNQSLTNGLVNTAISAGTVSAVFGTILYTLPKLLQVSGMVGVGLKSLTSIIGGLVIGVTMLATGFMMLQQNSARYNAMTEARIKMDEEAAKAAKGLANEYYEAAEAYADYAEIYIKSSGLSEKEKRLKLAEYDQFKANIRAQRELTEATKAETAAVEEQNEQAKKLIDSYLESQTQAARYGLTVEDITGYMVGLNRESELFNLNWGEIGTNAQAMANALGLAIDDVAAKTGKLRTETNGLREDIAAIIKQFEYEQSEAGQLGVTFEDIVAALNAAGLDQEWMTHVFGDIGTEVPTILEALHLNAQDIADFMDGIISKGLLAGRILTAFNENDIIPNLPQGYVPEYAVGAFPVPGPVGAPVPAIVHGGETIIPAGQTAAGSIMITGNTFIVRKEGDAQQIARELLRLSRTRG